MTGVSPVRRHGLYRDWLKRPFDLAFLALTLPVWGPVLLGAIVAVWISMGRPVFFRQDRIGHHDRPFRILKLRTMLDTRDAEGALLPDEARLTRAGRILRKTSLDELPEILNIVRGEMSIVGPRPLLPDYLPLYSPEQSRRHHVRPGLTGLAQVKGRNALTWPRKFALDLDYVDTLSLGRDLKIIGLTVHALVAARDISAPGHETMPRFMGETQETTAEEESAEGGPARADAHAGTQAGEQR